MGVDVSKLSPSPSTLKKGMTNVAISYNAIVSSAADNPVKLNLYIDPAAPAYFIENGVQVKTITKNVQINPGGLATYTWQIVIEITEKPSVPKACSLRLEASTPNDFRSSTNSFVIYH